jgi:hypothetical protein
MYKNSYVIGYKDFLQVTWPYKFSVFEVKSCLHILPKSHKRIYYRANFFYQTKSHVNHLYKRHDYQMKSNVTNMHYHEAIIRMSLAQACPKILKKEVLFCLFVCFGFYVTSTQYRWRKTSGALPCIISG